MVLSVHIPKTGGVSFRRILAQLYERDFLLKYWEMTDAWGRVVTSIPPNIRCIHGHYCPEVLLPQYPDATLITWVRDPVERVASSYFHRLRDPDWRHPVTRELHEKRLSLVEFASRDFMRNEIARFMGSKRPAEYGFIGLTEQFDASLRRFFRRLGLRPVAPVRDNCNPARLGDHYAIDDDSRRKIAALNELDMDIYAEACRVVAERERLLAPMP